MIFDPTMPVLVVDAQDAAITIVRRLLRQIRLLDVDDANNLADALLKMRGKRYGLVISDWRTEPMSGVDFLYEVRGDPALQRIAVIMTGNLNAQNVIAAKKAGANSYVVKPFDAETLKTKIEAALVTKTVLLPERRQGAAAPAAPATAAAPAADRVKFDGVFTSRLE